jgi:Flp pilus assembly pilin Flp
MNEYHEGRKDDRSDSGQGLVEFALGIVLVAVVTITSIALMGDAVSNTYCTVTEAMSDVPHEECYETPPQEGDGPVVFKPKFNSFNGGFTITAKILGECSGPLEVVGYGTMQQHGGSDLHSLTIEGDPPDSVTVGSTSCGWTTVDLT